MLKYDVVIFDLDGVICSTDEFHYQAWQALADELNIPFDRGVNDRLRGVSRMESLEIVLSGVERDFSQAEKQTLAARKNKTYRELLKNLTPQDILPGVRETLAVLRNRGIMLAIGSSSKNARFILERLGLEEYFDAVSDGTEISRSKPDPEVFLLAAQKLGVSPARCLVTEDAEAGAEAAHRGGMDAACVGPAAIAGVGEYNLAKIQDLLRIFAVAAPS